MGAIMANQVLGLVTQTRYDRTCRAAAVGRLIQVHFATAGNLVGN